MYQTTESHNTWSKKLTELKGKTDNSTIIVVDLNTLSSIMARTCQKINKRRPEQHHKPTNRHLQNIPLTNIKVYILLKGRHMEHSPAFAICEIIKQPSIPLKVLNHSKYVLWPQWSKIRNQLQRLWETQ